MANNLIFNNVASKLLTLANGVDSNNVTHPLLVDSNGIISLNTVTVTAHEFDIRKLNALTDSITVTAQNFDIRKLTSATDSVQLGSRLSKTSFTALSGVTNSTMILTETVIEQSQYSYFLRNVGANTVTCQIYVSPTTNSDYFIADSISGAFTVGPNTNKYIPSGITLAYSSLFYETSGAANSFNVYFLSRV